MANGSPIVRCDRPQRSRDGTTVSRRHKAARRASRRCAPVGIELYQRDQVGHHPFFAVTRHDTGWGPGPRGLTPWRAALGCGAPADRDLHGTALGLLCPRVRAPRDRGQRLVEAACFDGTVSTDSSSLGDARAVAGEHGLWRNQAAAARRPAGRYPPGCLSLIAVGDDNDRVVAAVWVGNVVVGVPAFSHLVPSRR